MGKCYRCNKHASFGIPGTSSRVSCKTHSMPGYVYKPGINHAMIPEAVRSKKILLMLEIEAIEVLTKLHSSNM